MRKIVLLGIVIFSFIELKAQMVVEDPLNASINSTIQALNASSNALNQFLVDTKALEFMTSGLDQINAVKEIASLVDDLACMSTDFSFYMNLDETYSCAKFLNFRLINMNLNFSTEILTSVVLSKNIFTMSSSDRLNNLTKIKDVLEKTIKEMQNINSAIKGNIIQKAYTNFIRKSYTPDPERTIAFDRYKNR